MAFKINGVEVNETSKLSTGNVFGSGKKVNGVQLNICYEYELFNTDPPFPPPPPGNASYDDCDGNSQSTPVNAGDPPITICALFGTVSADPQVSVSQGSRCSS
jgi:hypothetical protein